MRISVQKHVLESMLINLQPFLEKKDTSQITSHILIMAKKKELTLKATDLEMGLQLKTEDANIQGEGTATANGKKLLDIVRILKDEEIIIETLEETLHIKQEHSKFKLPMFNGDNYPDFPASDKLPSIALDSESLIQMLKKITPSIDNNNPKYELNGALINIKEKSIDIVGTDTRRLAIGKIDSENEEALMLIIPKKAIIEIQKLFWESIELHYDKTYLIIKTDRSYFFTRLINGKYPDYERIVPNSIKHVITLPKVAMIESIKQITTVSQELKLTLIENSVIFKSLSEENAEAQTEISVSTGMKDKFTFAVNSRYLLDFLTQIEEGNFVIGLNEPNLPFILQSDNFSTIIMPIII